MKTLYEHFPTLYLRQTIPNIHSIATEKLLECCSSHSLKYLALDSGPTPMYMLRTCCEQRQPSQGLPYKARFNLFHLSNLKKVGAVRREKMNKIAPLLPLKNGQNSILTVRKGMMHSPALKFVDNSIFLPESQKRSPAPSPPSSE